MTNRKATSNTSTESSSLLHASAELIESSFNLKFKFFNHSRGPGGGRCGRDVSAAAAPVRASEYFYGHRHGDGGSLQSGGGLGMYHGGHDSH